ncbi:glycosyltransferase family 4 protein [Pedobacter fastidiosus]|uniref:Glycosyltransferase family 4 protein n=1 Tax=Pedobacter fastidiosus TaxID=2765361 RepID=A0ABR7KVT5_9SPHI|nr:glycosyltransferase family 4 protein [Pedobacter fastidiosus]MBC6112150.1 glycosyltransferase family 4 protein [Pedobacter fastidiosus]
MKRLAIITTHPIQYYAPAFRLLAKGITLRVFYTGGVQLINQFDKGFNKKIKWDIPLLEGYDYEFLENLAIDSGTHHFKGISNPMAIKSINNYRPDSILIFGWAFESHLKIIRHFNHKVPLYFRGDSTLIDNKSGIKLILKKLFLTWVYRHFDFAFYVGEKNKEYFMHYGFPSKKLRFSPHAIDNIRFSENRVNEVSILRRQLGIVEEDILILFAGKLEKKKNPEILLNAFIELDLSNVHLLFVGDGELGEILKAESVKAKANHRIHFMSFQNQTQMPAIYQACDLFCLPSKGPRETWGLAVNEAMAAGKAILVSDKVGCCVDLVKPKINGDVFKSEDLRDLKNKLLYLVSDKNELSKLGEASKIIIKEWSFEKQVDSFLKTFNS